MVAADSASMTAVTVSFNTKELTALLVWSLNRVLLKPLLQVVVVDNGSTDGSTEMLREVEEEGLCRLLVNDRNLHHGPALNQALTYLAAQSVRPRFVWVLDSDVVISHAGAADRLLVVATASRAAIVGEKHWDPWRKSHRFELYSLLIELATLWRPGAPSFTDDGDPAFELLKASRKNGHVHIEFPFATDGYVIHRGRASLATVMTSADVSNPLYEWSLDHHEPHYGDVVGARERYDVLLTQFRAEVPELTGGALAAACGRGSRGRPTSGST